MYTTMKVYNKQTELNTNLWMEIPKVKTMISSNNIEFNLSDEMITQLETLLNWYKNQTTKIKKQCREVNIMAVLDINISQKLKQLFEQICSKLDHKQIASLIEFGKEWNFNLFTELAVHKLAMDMENNSISEFRKMYEIEDDLTDQEKQQVNDIMKMQQDYTNQSG